MNALTIANTALRAAPAVTAIAGPRIYLVQAPQGDALPSLVITGLSEAEDYTLGNGAGNFPEARIAVICRAPTASQALALGDTVLAALKNLRGPQATFFREPMDSTDFSPQPAPGMFRRVLGFRVRYRS